MVPVIKKKRYLLITLLVLLLAVFAFLPFILSSSPVTRMIVSGLNKKTSGTLRIGSFLVGWQQGFLCQDILYEDRQRGLRLSIPRLTSTQGLAELIFLPGNLGLVALDTPVLEFTAPPPPGDFSPESSVTQSAVDGQKAAWEKITLQLQVRDGSIEIKSNDGQPETGVKDVNLHSSLSAGEIDFDFRFRAMADQGEFAAKGRVNLPTGRKNILETLYTETEVSIRDFQIRDYLSFAAHRFRLPVGEGVLTADVRLKTAGLEDFELSGSAEAGDLKLAGSILGQDTPSFQKIRLTLEDGEWSKLYRRARLIHLESDAGSLNFSGEYKDSRIQINSSANINIPVLFDRFPHLLKVREEAFIESGTLEFSADMAVEEHKGKFDFMARTENLGGLFNGRPFVWDKPVTAILHGENEGFDIRIRRLQVDAPFLQAYGKGDLTSFDLEAKADVGKTLAELGKLFHHTWAGSGKLELLMKAAAGSGNLYTVDTDLNISRFSLSRKETVVVPNQHFSIVGSASVPFSLLREKEGAFDLQFALSSWLGEIFFAMNGDRKKEGLKNARYSTDTNLQLDSIVSLLHALDVVPEETDIGGDLQIQAAGYIDGSLVGFDEFNSRIHDFAYRKNDIGFSDPEVRLYINRAVNDDIPSLVLHDLEIADSRETFFRAGGGMNSIDVSAFSLFLHDIGMDAKLGNMQLEELVMENWHKPLDTVRAKGVIDADLQMLTPLLQQTLLPARDISLNGAGHLEFSSAEKGESGRDITAGLHIDSFSVRRGDTLLLPADDLKLLLYLEERPLADNLFIKDLQLFTGPLDLTADGSVKLVDTDRQLELQGILTPKMDKLADILDNAFDMGIAMQGQESREFAMQCRWPEIGKVEGAWPVLSFAAALQADRIDFRGLQFSEMSIPVSLDDKMLQVKVRGRLNEGTVDFSAQSDFGRDPVTLLVPENSRIMTDVELREPLVEGILQAIHPLFGVLAKPTGRMNVTLDSFSWPLKPERAAEAVFAAVFDVSRINLDNSGLLRSILTGFAMEDEKLQLRDTQISCSAGQGRISCTPVRILAADSEMVLSGSVGMDKSLDYVLEVPITEKLVSKEVHALLKGATVKVPITGSVGKPAFDQKMMTAVIRDLVRKAAVKVVEQQAEKLLPDLMQGDRRKPQKK